MKSRTPFVWAVLAGLAVLVVAFVPVLLQMGHPRPGPAALDDLPAPWHIERGPGGELLAFGLRLPGSTLADAVRRWGDDLQVAVIGRSGEPAALEAYTDRWTGGGVTGQLVLITDADATDVIRWQEQAGKRQIIDARARRWQLSAADRTDALRSGVRGVSFLPASRVDADTLKARFGSPAETMAGEGTTRHALYPERGLAIAWDEATGKAVVQVVALADFEARLRAPLLAAAQRPRASSATPAGDPPR